MDHGTAESVGATIAFKSSNLKGPGSLRLIAAACGDASFMSKVSLPAAEMMLRGLGGSKVSGNTPQALGSRKSYLADFDAVKKEAKGGRATALLGYSHAGYFVTAYALANPKKVSALVLMEPALFTSRAELLKRAKLAESGNVEKSIAAMLKYVAPNHPKTESLSEKNEVTKAVQSGETLASEFRVRAENPIKLAQLKKLKMPVLLIGGTESAQRESVEKIAGVLPSASVWWVHGANHLDLLSKQHAKQIGGVIQAFLDDAD